MKYSQCNISKFELSYGENADIAKLSKQIVMNLNFAKFKLIVREEVKTLLQKLQPSKYNFISMIFF